MPHYGEILVSHISSIKCDFSLFIHIELKNTDLLQRTEVSKEREAILGGQVRQETSICRGKGNTFVKKLSG
jgi:hypothetical protein